MTPGARKFPLATLFAIVCCSAALAPSHSLAQMQLQPRTITVRMIDSRTGLLISTENFLVRVDHKKEQHGDWTEKNEDGTSKLTLPGAVELISIHATYDYATQTYSNCDVNKDHGGSDHAPKPDVWYSVEAILATGVVAPNDCVGKKVPEKLQLVAKPGEFIFFVRPESSMEKMRD